MTKAARVSFRMLTLVSLVAYGACDADLPTDPAFAVSLEIQGAWADSLALLDTATVEVVIRDQGGQIVQGPVLEWVSSDESVLRVTAVGDSLGSSALLFGNGLGSASLSVRVADPRFSGDTVSHPVAVVPLGLEAIAGQTIAMDVGSLQTISVALRSADGTPTDAADVSWTTDAASRVSVIAADAGIGVDGVAEALLVARSSGAATISVAVEAAGGGATVQFSVTASRDTWPGGLAVGESADVAIIDVSGGTIDSIGWSAQDATVLGVDAGGAGGTSVLGRRQGTTTVVAQVSRAGFPRFSMDVPLQVVPITIERVDWSDELKLGDSSPFQIRTLGFDSTVVDVPVRWAPSNGALRIDSISADTLSAHFFGVALGSAEVIVVVGGGGLEEQELRVPLPVRQQWKEISVGYGHACAVAENGTLYCWGENTHGQLGDGSTEARVAPTPVATLNKYGEVAAGTLHSCARAGPVVDCWGSYRYGQLGDGSGPCWDPFSIVDYCFSPTPVRSSAFIGIGPNYEGPTLTVGQTVTCVLELIDFNPGTTTRCYGDQSAGYYQGYGIEGGELGHLGGAGDRHACRVSGVGLGIICTGTNESGQLGDGTTTPSTGGTRVVTVDDEILDGQNTVIAAGGAHHCAYDVAQGPNGARTIWCWGSNSAGQLGPNGPAGLSTVAVRVPPPASFGTVPYGGNTGRGSLTLGGEHSCMLSDLGIAYCWGDNFFGQLGDGSSGGSRPNPAVAAPGVEFIHLSAGNNRTCGVATDRSLFCWGEGLGGTPVRVGEPLGS